MLPSRKDLSAAQVRALLDYCPETGVFRWRERVGSEHEVICWNPKWAGKIAGYIDKRGYRCIKINGTYYAAHRLAWIHVTGEWPTLDLDHKNGLRGDNRFANLREANRSENCANAPRQANNKVGLKGVCKKRGYRSAPYHAQISKHGKVYHLGYYKTAEEAHAAYVEAAQRIHGDFARAE